MTGMATGKKKYTVSFFARNLVLFGPFLILLILWSGSGKYFWKDIQFILEIFLLTFLTRTVTGQTSLSTFFKGIYFCLGFIFIFYWLSKISGIDVRGIFYRGFIVASAEEAIKLVPVVLVAYFVYKRRKISVNLSDFLWLGILSGTAFGMVEKTFWQGIHFPFTYGPHIGNFYFFPTALGIYTSGGQLGYIGHSAATGLLALALGWGLYFKRKTDSSVGKLWWLFPVIIYAWVVLEHALNNAHYAGASYFLHILGGGQLTPVFFILAFIITTGFELYHLFRFFRAHSQAGQGLRLGIKQVFSSILKNRWGATFAVFQATLKFYRNVNKLSWQSTYAAGVSVAEKPVSGFKQEG